MKYYKIKSFAKINLYLGIISKMRNKMHKIESIVLKAAWERNQNIDRRKQDWKLLKGRAVVE